MVYQRALHKTKSVRKPIYARKAARLRRARRRLRRRRFRLRRNALRAPRTLSQALPLSFRVNHCADLFIVPRPNGSGRC